MEQQEIKVGAILSGSWGYDQTQVEFYKVVRTTEKSAWLVALGEQMVPSQGYSPMAGLCIPADEVAADAKVLGPVRIRGQGRYCNEPKYGHCSLSVWDGKPEYVSWYA